MTDTNQTLNTVRTDSSDNGTTGIFVDLCTNAGVKHAFADPANERSMPALKALLNYYLPADHQIDKINGYENVEVPGFTLNNRDIVIDIRCSDIHGRQFIVEMQRYSQDTFFCRTVAYISSVYRENLGRGPEGYKSLRPVFLLALLDTPLVENGLKDDDRLVARYSFRDEDNKYFAPKTLSAIFVRLQNLPEDYGACANDEQKCAWIVKHSGTLREIPMEESKSGIGEILKAAEIAAYDKDKKKSYEKEIMFENDYYAQLDYAERKGLAEGEAKGLVRGKAEGLAEGEVKGRSEEARSIALNLKNMGLPLDQISKGTGLTVEQIAAL